MRAKELLRYSAVLVAIVFVLFFQGCADIEKGCSSPEARAALVNEVDNLINQGSCNSAIETIEPFYEVKGCNTDEIRLSRASAYACKAGVNFFSMITDLSNSAIAINGIFEMFARLFPSVFEDSKVLAAQYSLDSLFAIKVPGSLTPPLYTIHAGTLNEGSLIATQRTDDSNVYSMFVSMAILGTLENRYAAPSVIYEPTTVLGYTSANHSGWAKATATAGDGCRYAGALLTFTDSVLAAGTKIGSTFGGNVGTALTNVSTALNTALNLGCDQGCKGLSGSGCAIAAGCTCPLELRNPSSCLGTNTDTNSCAAAGLINYVNLTWAL